MATAYSSASSIPEVGGTADSPRRAGKPAAGRPGVLLRRGLAVTFGLVVAAAAILGTTQAPASAAPVPGTVNQCNYIQDGGGNEIACDVTITNYLDLDTGLSRSDISVRTCEGAVGELVCTNIPVSFPTATTVVDQCNNSANGGGSIATCNVTVENIITGDATTSPATVNQCNGSGAEGPAPTLNCAPVSSTTSATITQCNASVNGGGAARRVTCTVDPSTVSAALPVTIRQCNDSVNGGGSTLTCTASMTNRILPAGTVVPTPTQPPVSTSTPTPTPTPGDTTTPTPTPSSTPPSVGAGQTPSPSATAANPLIPVAAGGGGSGAGYGTELAETGTDAQPVFLVAAGALLAGGILFAVMLLRRRSNQVQAPADSAELHSDTRP
ncbi:LPXTG cell wall anchor domain-containing protein [Cryobacterium sp. N22]|uniref:LPXTG cell wall anchor domain-containing protein n=1 Tax=Cryobacterium sp. N22 TaxID=2048290 RepID=UPI0011B087E6|nr:LPXTG cell wall anchor domain-containing protein [Cryobacterium sp. N22]